MQSNVCPACCSENCCNEVCSTLTLSCREFRETFSEACNEAASSMSMAVTFAEGKRTAISKANMPVPVPISRKRGVAQPSSLYVPRAQRPKSTLSVPIFMAHLSCISVKPSMENPLFMAFGDWVLEASTICSGVHSPTSACPRSVACAPIPYAQVL